MNIPRLALVATLVPVVAGCARRSAGPPGEQGAERPVSDVAAAYACAADAAQGLGYTVPNGVLDRVRTGPTAGGGSFTAERRTPGGNVTELAQLFVRVRGSRDDGGTLRVVPWRQEELYADAPAATSAPLRPELRPPNAGIQPRQATEPRRRGRGAVRRTLPAGPVAEDALAVVGRCAG